MTLEDFQTLIYQKKEIKNSAIIFFFLKKILYNKTKKECSLYEKYEQNAMGNSINYNGNNHSVK